MKAGLGQLRLLLSPSLPGTSQRVDALLLGTGVTGLLTVVLVDVDDLVRLDETDALLVAVDGVPRTHPSRRAAAAAAYLRARLASREQVADVRAVTILHRASPGMVDRLRAAAANSHGSREVSLLGTHHLDEDRFALIDHFRCTDLSAPTDEQVQQFLEAAPTPARPVVEQLPGMVREAGDLVLLGPQQDAYLSVTRAAARASNHVFAVTGGPGTGKTALAVRLVADVPRRVAGQQARYMTSSAPAFERLQRAGRPAAVENRFALLDGSAAPLGDRRELRVVDDAHRIERRTGVLARVLDGDGTRVFCFDDRQASEAGRGVTVAELAAAAGRRGRSFTHVDLTAQFRCAGSARYLIWVDDVLFGEDTRGWTGDQHYLGLAETEVVLRNWLNGHATNGHTAELVTARPGGASAWCGHELDYAAVLIGPDLFRRRGRWVTGPARSRDATAESSVPEDHLRAVLLTYRMLMTRASRGVLLHSSDPETHDFLKGLLPFRAMRGSE